MAKKKRPKRRRGSEPKLERLSGEELSKLKPGPLRHEELDEFSTDWIRWLYKRVGHLHSPTFEQWEIGFLRDSNYHREIMVWEAIARAFEAYVEQHPEDDNEETVSMLCAISAMGELDPETDKTRELRRLFREYWQRMGDDVEGVIHEVGAAMNQDAMPNYLLVREGLVQRIMTEHDGEVVKVWPVAKTSEDAKRLAEWMDEPGVVPAEIGSVEGETLEGHIELALEEGCIAACCVLGWNVDGEPKWGWMSFEEDDEDGA